MAADDPWLAAVLNLSRFHRDHEKFYAEHPREQAVQLQRHSRTLKALADRWRRGVPEPAGGASSGGGASSEMLSRRWSPIGDRRERGSSPAVSVAGVCVT